MFHFEIGLRGSVKCYFPLQVSNIFMSDILMWHFNAIFNHVGFPLYSCILFQNLAQEIIKMQYKLDFKSFDFFFYQDCFLQSF